MQAYNFSEFNPKQMEQIMMGVKQRVDITKYKDPKLNWKQMREIRLGLVMGIDLSHLVMGIHTEPIYWWHYRTLRRIRKDLTEYVREKYNMNTYGRSDF